MIEVFPLARQEAITSKYVVQYAFSALASGTAIPMIDSIGVGLQCTISVILQYIAGGLCALTAVYGINMLNWVDRRWPTKRGTMGKTEIMYDGAALHHTVSAH
jgi:hypothetical protein